jgi:hypothetical protein
LNLALIVMREAEVPEYDPAYTVPLYPVTPILGAVVSFALIAFIEPRVVLLGLGFVAFAVLWYLLYVRSRTVEGGVLADFVLSRSEEFPEGAVSAARSVQPDGGGFRVMAPLANPEHETDLIEFGGALAKDRGGELVAVHVVTILDQTPLPEAAARIEAFDPGRASCWNAPARTRKPSACWSRPTVSSLIAPSRRSSTLHAPTTRTRS